MRMALTCALALALLCASADSAQVLPLEDGNGLSWRGQFDAGVVEAYGKDSIRVRFGRARVVDVNAPGAILEQKHNKGTQVVMHSSRGGGNITNGDLRAEVRVPSDDECCSNTGMVVISFYRESTGEEIIAEYYPLHGRPARDLRATSRGSKQFSASVSFKAYEGEHLYGLGQHQHGMLDQKGLVIDLVQHNTEVAIPFVLSSRGYGLAWNVPSEGRVELGYERTRWVADATEQVDYLVMLGEQTPPASATEVATAPAPSTRVPPNSPLFSLMQRLVEATGRSPALPHYATGFIQCKLRYATQGELLNVTREFKTRNIPLSMIVVDYLHWAHQGDWAFDPKYWPDPKSMVDEISADGVEVMVSVWPTVSVDSSNYEAMRGRGLLVGTETGGGSQGNFGITSSFHSFGSEVDPFNPESRAFLWSQLRANYLKLGIRNFWLDADEGGGDGEGDGGAPADETYYLGSQSSVGPMFPQFQQRALYDGLANSTPSLTGASLTLSRSAWLGSQRYGSALWSGDTVSTFESLQLQVVAGLNAQMSGVAWWTTDAGGFMLGRNQNTDPYFRELLVRWFQFAMTCPLFRNHGDRACDGVVHNFTTCPNEPWSFGAEVLALLNKTITARENLRPYVSEQMALTSSLGRPLMRPLFFDFPELPLLHEQAGANNKPTGTGSGAYGGASTQYMFGDRYMAAPVMEYGARNRTVFFPPGTWTHFWSNASVVSPAPHGMVSVVDAPLDELPMWQRS